MSVWQGWYYFTKSEMFVGWMTCIVLLLMLNTQVVSQDWEMDFGVGVLNYQGELRAERFTSKGMRPAISIGIAKGVGERNSLLARFSSGMLTGRDADNPNYLTRRRNLDFETFLHELSLGFRRFIFSNPDGWCAPFVNAGVAMFWVNPYTHDRMGVKYSLYDLSLEGQGLPQYPSLKTTQKLNVSLPVGAGLSLHLADRLRMDMEMTACKTFTDQIDGVGGYYPNMESLRSMRGPIAVDLSYRSDELPGEDLVFPPEGNLRGNPVTKDWYYGLMLRFAWNLGQSGYTYPHKHRLFKPRGWPYRL